MEHKQKLAIIGCGHLGTLVADALTKGLLPDYELVGVMNRTFVSAQALAKKTHCQACETLDALLALKPDYVVEAASPATVTSIAHSVLRAGANLVVLSIGAFANEAFYEETKRVARESGRRVHLASGAIGGFDVLRTAALMGGISAQITTEKGPASLRNTPLFREELMTAATGETVLTGSAKDAIAVLPTKVNVAVAASLATAGPEHTKVTIRSVPGFIGDDHKIEVENSEVRATVDIYSKTSDIAGWSVVALLQNLVSPIMF